MGNVEGGTVKVNGSLSTGLLKKWARQIFYYLGGVDQGGVPVEAIAHVLGLQGKIGHGIRHDVLGFHGL